MAPPQIRYAGFWIRYLGYVLDGFLLAALLLVLTGAVGGETAFTCVTSPQSFSTAQGSIVATTSSCSPSSLAFFVNMIGGFLYFGICWSTGGTLGQRILGLRVVEAVTGQNISLGRGLVRYIGFLLSMFCLCFGLIWAAADPRKQGWHDKMAGTVVIHKSRYTGWPGADRF